MAMTRELQNIPPAHRRVRWAFVVWWRWPMGLLGASLVIYGGLFALMLMSWAGGKPHDDALLDRAETLTAMAEITAVETSAATIHKTAAERVTYYFLTGDGTTVRGSSFGRAGEFAVHGRVPVRYLASAPETNRLQNTRISLLGDMVTPVTTTVVLPGAVLLLCWLLGVWRFRRLLAHGDAAVAELTRVEPVRWVVPVMLRVHYRFRDHHACWCEGHHWVRARSVLGERLTTRPGQLVAIHDRRHPASNRLVTADGFRNTPVPRFEGETVLPA